MEDQPLADLIDREHRRVALGDELAAEVEWSWGVATGTATSGPFGASRVVTAMYSSPTKMPYPRPSTSFRNGRQGPLGSSLIRSARGESSLVTATRYRPSGEICGVTQYASATVIGSGADRFVSPSR